MDRLSSDPDNKSRTRRATNRIEMTCIPVFTFAVEADRQIAALKERQKHESEIRRLVYPMLSRDQAITEKKWLNLFTEFENSRLLIRGERSPAPGASGDQKTSRLLRLPSKVHHACSLFPIPSLLYPFDGTDPDSL